MLTSTISDLRQNLKTYFDKVIEDNETIIINRGKGKGIVILSLEEYNLLQQAINDNSSKK